MSGYWASLIGGMIIGLSAVLLLLVNGRIAGISGIVGRLAQGANILTNGAFVVGLALGPVLFLALFGHGPAVSVTGSWPLIVVAGLLVGFGTRMGNGCTSGHGVCGLGRLSLRSLVAVITFMATAISTTFIVRHTWN
jgi:uncharacterized membrane protein YedE/YeeE